MNQYAQNNTSAPATEHPECHAAAHIVLDLETLSTDPHATVASIGAVALTAQGSFVSEFHQAVSTEHQYARHISPSTCEWWDKQSNEARAASILAPNPAHPIEALKEFTCWVLQISDPKKVKVWGNGSGFDNVILSSLFADYHGLERPWAYWNDRDMRTVLDLHPHAKDVGEFVGIKHHALYDAQHEAKQLARVLATTQSAVQEMNAIKQAIREYHFALNSRMHGGVAAGNAIRSIEAALGMDWKQGKEAETQAAKAQQGAAA